MSNNNNENIISNLKNQDPEKLKKAMDTVRSLLGDKAKGLESIIHNEQALNDISKKISPNDLGKLSVLLDNPEMLKKMLSSDKAKEGLKKFFENQGK